MLLRRGLGCFSQLVAAHTPRNYAIQNGVLATRPLRSLLITSLRKASSHSHGPAKGAKEAEECTDSKAGHGKEDHGHGHGDGHGHDDHHHDPYATWYEDPPSNLVYRSSRLKVPFYIGFVPEASYREPSKNGAWFQAWQANILGAIVWWWIFWGLLAQPGHVFGEWFVPDRREFSDAELGIPPLDA